MTQSFCLSLADLERPNPLFEAIEMFQKNHGRIVFLHGDIAAGKTTLVKAYAAFRGISGVCSPTFALAQSYPCGLWHYDLYRVSVEKALSLGILDLLSAEGLHYIEWGRELEQICVKLGIIPLLTIDITDAMADKRNYRISICTC